MDEKTSAAAGTDDKSPATNNETGFQKAFKAKLEEWKKNGCAADVEGKPCGAPPHRMKAQPPKDGNVDILFDCAKGHEAQWLFTVTEEEFKADLARQREAALAAGKDPMEASVTIRLNLRTQQVAIEPNVPTPGVGLQLAAMLTAHFSTQFMSGMKAVPAKPAIITADKKIVAPNGRPIGG